MKIATGEFVTPVWWIDYYFEGRRYRQKIGSMKKAGEALAQELCRLFGGWDGVDLGNFGQCWPRLGW